MSRRAHWLIDISDKKAIVRRNGIDVTDQIRGIGFAAGGGDRPVVRVEAYPERFEYEGEPDEVVVVLDHSDQILLTRLVNHFGGRDAVEELLGGGEEEE